MGVFFFSGLPSSTVGYSVLLLRGVSSGGLDFAAGGSVASQATSNPNGLLLRIGGELAKVLPPPENRITK